MIQDDPRTFANLVPPPGCLFAKILQAVDVTKERYERCGHPKKDLVAADKEAT